MTTGSSMMSAVRVNASIAYDVCIGESLTDQVGILVASVKPTCKVLLVTDDRVDERYGSAVEERLQVAGFVVSKQVIPQGEQCKNLTTLELILEYAAEQQLTRNDLFVALGGGVIGDVTGFAASVYMRGIDFIQLPTTLLAAVDASVGGKTAVDLVHGKNLAGTFWQPRMVICDLDILRTLPTGIFHDGMAEVIKHGVIGDEAILTCIEQNKTLDQLNWLVQRNVEIKRDIVEKDERELGVRKILNFGHTVAHAIEKTSRYRVPHGIAVGTGMVYETRMAERLGICADGLAARIERICRRFDLFVEQRLDAHMIHTMMLDKKNVGEQIVFALPVCIGSFKIVKKTIAEVHALFGI